MGLTPSSMLCQLVIEVDMGILARIQLSLSNTSGPSCKRSIWYQSPVAHVLSWTWARTRPEMRLSANEQAVTSAMTLNALVGRANSDFSLSCSPACSTLLAASDTHVDEHFISTSWTPSTSLAIQS
jgi:hypothetical protein